MEELKIPKHVAIILDGNGRWAKKRMMPRNYGHKKGADNVEKICRAAYNRGVKYLTVYAFSTENWKRSQEEIDGIMKILKNYLDQCMEISKKNNMRVRVIGDITRLDVDMQEKIKRLEEVSSKYTGLNFQVALNYGSRDEICRAVTNIVKDAEDGKISKEDITEELISDYLDTKDMPDPELMIRTSGEKRLSNYLLWQLAYAEFYFTDVLWPDFNEVELDKAFEFYNKRNRRFGGV